jgi:hypothetical protein
MSANFKSLPLVPKIRMLAQSRLAWVLVAIVGAGIASNLSADEEAAPIAARSQKSAKETLLREGSRVESKRAKCRAAGDRLVIEFDDARTLDALPNLAAQRVFQACRDDSADSEWIVSGKITEFQNLNYLLLENVVRASSR